MRYRIRHVTRYDYSASVSVSHNEARLVPRITPHQQPVGTRLSIEPAAAVLVEDRDYFGNVFHFFTVQEAHVRLSVTASSEVEVARSESPVLALSLSWEAVRDRVQGDTSPEALAAFELTLDSPHVRTSADLKAYAAVSFSPRRPLLEAVFELTRRIREDFEYVPGSTTVATPLDQVFERRQGVCQDFAHLQLAMLRAFGLSAAYVSGYVYNAPAAGQPTLLGADASHAWVSLWCPGFGSVDFDPTNGSMPNDEHITLARGRDFSDACPLRGVILGGGEHRVHVGVDVQRA